MDKDGKNVTGSPFTSTSLAGATVAVPGDTVQVRLTSDYSIVKWGFEVTSVSRSGRSQVECHRSALTFPRRTQSVALAFGTSSLPPPGGGLEEGRRLPCGETS